MFALTARRRVAAVALGAGLVAVPVASAFGPAANAAGGEACQFTGSTTSLTPIPVTGANSGSYAFNGSGTCVGSVGTGSIAISVSNGHYDNIQCGTGTATGTAVITGAINVTLGYSITFTGGQGVLTLTSGGTGAGPVSIVPQTGGCVTAPATSFTVTGSVGGTF
jgi:hypothetical protein